METQIFIHAKNVISKKSSKKIYQNPSRFYNSVTNFKFQHKPKYHLPNQSTICTSFCKQIYFMHPFGLKGDMN